eukprot:g3364.t1
MVDDEFTSEDDASRRRGGRRSGEGVELGPHQPQSWLSFSSKFAEAGAGAVATKAGRLRQKALSVVDTVQTLSSHNSSNSCTITVKSSPPRTAAEMTKLSVRRGWMLKRNEQRAWQRRYCCLVPHTFLYYFESKDSEVPRGVIDLDPYTDIEVDQTTGAIVLGPGSDAAAARQGLRKFYLRPEDRPATMAAAAAAATATGNGEGDGDLGQYWVPRRRSGGGGEGGEALGEWLSGFHRERYKVVRDERDAYMNLQEEYMAQMQDTTSAMSEAESERGRVLQGLRAEHAAARAAARDGLEQARALFREEDLPPEDAASLPLPALLARVRAVASERRAGQTRLEAELAAALGALEGARGGEGVSRGITERLRAEGSEAAARARNAEARLARAEEEAARERGLRAVAEASLKACTDRLESVLVDAEQGQVNLGIMAGERRAALAKAAELSEQKRLLVREVKTCRRSLAEASSVNRRLALAYESLERSLRSSSSAASGVAAVAALPDDTKAPGNTTATPSTTATTTPEHSPIAATGAAAAVAGGAVEGSASADGPGGGGGGGGSSSGGGGGGFATPPRAGQGTGSESPVGALLAGDGWREARLGSSSSSSGGGGGAAGGWTGDWKRPSPAAAGNGRIQVRNLSTGNVGELDPLGEGGARGRASTEGGASGDWTPSTWEPHSSNLGLKITQTLASASWPWGTKDDTATPAPTPTPAAGGSGAGTLPVQPTPACDAGESTSGGSTRPDEAALPRRGGNGGLGDDGDRDVGDAGKAAGAASGRSGGGTGSSRGMNSSSSYSSFVGAFENVVSSIGSSGGSGGAGGGRRRARGGVGASGPSLCLDDDDGGGSVAHSGGLDVKAATSAARDMPLSGADSSYHGVPSSSVAGAGASDGSVLGEARWSGTGDMSDGVGAEPAEGTLAKGGVEVVVCRRCGGTVEGPQNSTCTCKVPELNTDPLDAANNEATVGLSRLKGVFKSFNGGVEVARQMLDSAVRQNVANNMAPPRPPRPPPLSGGGRRRSLSSSAHGSSAHGSSAHGSSAHGSSAHDDGVVVSPGTSGASAVGTASLAGAGVDTAPSGGGGGGGSGGDYSAAVAGIEVMVEEEEGGGDKVAGGEQRVVEGTAGGRDPEGDRNSGCADRDVRHAAVKSSDDRNDVLPPPAAGELAKNDPLGLKAGVEERAGGIGAPQPPADLAEDDGERQQSTPTKGEAGDAVGCCGGEDDGNLDQSSNAPPGIGPEKVAVTVTARVVEERRPDGADPSVPVSTSADATGTADTFAGLVLGNSVDGAATHSEEVEEEKEGVDQPQETARVEADAVDIRAKRKEGVRKSEMIHAGDREGRERRDALVEPPGERGGSDYREEEEKGAEEEDRRERHPEADQGEEEEEAKEGEQEKQNEDDPLSTLSPPLLPPPQPLAPLPGAAEPSAASPSTPLLPPPQPLAPPTSLPPVPSPQPLRAAALDRRAECGFAVGGDTAPAPCGCVATSLPPCHHRAQVGSHGGHGRRPPPQPYQIGWGGREAETWTTTAGAFFRFLVRVLKSVFRSMDASRAQAAAALQEQGEQRPRVVVSPVTFGGAGAEGGVACALVVRVARREDIDIAIMNHRPRNDRPDLPLTRGMDLSVPKTIAEAATWSYQHRHHLFDAMCREFHGLLSAGTFT